MRMGILIVMLSLAVAVAGQTPADAGAARTGRSPATRPCPCSATAAELADQQQEAAELTRAVAALRARMTMLRNDAGTLGNQQVRDALQVDAEMWASLIELLQSRADRLQQRSAPAAGTR
jgi:hypothetical protein